MGCLRGKYAFIGGHGRNRMHNTERFINMIYSVHNDGDVFVHKISSSAITYRRFSDPSSSQPEMYAVCYLCIFLISIDIFAFYL